MKYILTYNEKIDYKFKNKSMEIRYGDILSVIDNCKIGDIIPNNIIYQYVEYLTDLSNKYDDSFIYGNLGERLDKYEQYILKEIDISDIDIEEFNTDEHYVKKYKDVYNNTKDYPPVVLESNYSIIDGTHRLQSLNDVGVKKIKAFVGLE